MRYIIQNIGAIIGIIVACIGYILAIYSSKKEDLNEWVLFEKLMFSSAVGLIILLLFCAVSLLF